MPGLGDAVNERRGTEEQGLSEDPEGGAAGGAGLPPCRPKEEMTGEVNRKTEKRRDGETRRACRAREVCGRGEPGQRTGTACGALAGSDDGGRKGRVRVLREAKAWEGGVELREAWDDAARLSRRRDAVRTRGKKRTRGYCEDRHCLTSGISGERSESAACRG